MRILREIPDCILWLLGQSEGAVANLSRYARLEGIGPDRLIFAPFAAPHDHFARLPVADAILDALVCNGHTTTSDALWAGVPVITAHGAHFASRVSESLLNAIGLSELVGLIKTIWCASPNGSQPTGTIGQRCARRLQSTG